MSHHTYATAWAALLALEPLALSAFMHDAAAYHDKQTRRTVSPSRSPGFMPSDTGVAPLCEDPTRAMRRGSSWPLLPLIGGSDLDLAPSDRFLSCEFQRRYQPGALTLVYSAGCCGLRELAAPLRLLIYKIGTHGSDDLNARMRQLNAKRYAGHRQSGGDCEAGFSSWMIEPLQPRFAEASPKGPVRVRNDGLELTLPFGLTNARFDQQLNRALCTATLENFARSGAGEAFCKGSGVDPASLLRGTDVGRDQTESARELVLFRPLQDLQRLVRVCEDLIYQHVIEAP
jgi:hypothetical protein